ncbi:MAG: carboxy-S-adenosyl-L-methionine synthase CmoA [Candidatus Dasytiphilus stammeri]
MQKYDQIFSLPLTKSQWSFDEDVTQVFSNMIKRSIPGYSIIINMIGKLSQKFVKNHTQIYDLGCSLGDIAISIQKNLQANKSKGCQIIAIDNSPSMITQLKQKIKQQKTIYSTIIKIIENDINKSIIRNASMVVLNFTLQFIPLEKREHLLKSIFAGLNSEGVLIISEKFKFNNYRIDQIITNLYYDFKKNHGYSDFEIIQKQNLLKKVMIIETIENQIKTLQKIGFVHVDLWFQYLNFGSLIAIKN